MEKVLNDLAVRSDKRMVEFVAKKLGNLLAKAKSGSIFAAAKQGSRDAENVDAKVL